VCNECETRFGVPRNDCATSKLLCLLLSAIGVRNKKTATIAVLNGPRRVPKTSEGSSKSKTKGSRVKSTALQVATTASRKWITRFVVTPSVSIQIDSFLGSPVRIGALYKPTKWFCYWSNIREIRAIRFYRDIKCDFVCAQY
jgi:hypothetical protein